MESDQIPFGVFEDFGTDTLRRFAYQAKVIFPFVLRCAQGGDEIAVIPEHIDDCFLLRSSGSVIMQIKSRDVAQGGWTLGELLARGGAVRSLHRAFALNPTADVIYQAMLEQTLSRSNEAVLLRTAEGRANEKLIHQVSERLEIQRAEAQQFLQRFRLREGLPTRETIDAVNLRLLHSAAPGWSHSKTEQIYASTLQVIWSAMQAEAIGVSWPQYTNIEEGPDEHLKERLKAKKMDRLRCQQVLGNLSTQITTALTRELDPNLPPPSNLERKLLAGGASSQVVAHAKELRARALTIEIERASGSAAASVPTSSGDPMLYEVQKKVEWHSVAANAKFANVVNPANQVWNELLIEFPKLATNLDPHGIFGQDGYLILGELCELSDQCVTGWGGSA